MSKRRYPFENHLYPQTKIHVGEKEIADGVDKNNMHRIHEKTLNALRAGSKSSTLAGKRPEHTRLDLCGCCRVLNQDEFSKCHYCDQIMCYLCLVQCAHCNRKFCQSCSLALYDKENHHACLNCYSYQS